MNFVELNEHYPNENRQRQFMQNLLLSKLLPLAFGRDSKVSRGRGKFIVEKKKMKRKVSAFQYALTGGRSLVWKSWR